MTITVLIMTNDVIYQDFFNELKEYLLTTTPFTSWTGYTRRPLTTSTIKVPFFYTELTTEEGVDVLDINGTHTTDDENGLNFNIVFAVHNPDKRKTDLQDLADAESQAVKDFRTELYNYLKDTTKVYSKYFTGMSLAVVPTAFQNGQKLYETYTINIISNYKHTMSTGA